MPKRFNCKNEKEMIEEIGNRIIVFDSLTGSDNYNLNTKDSDKDKKVFIMPNVDDIYNHKVFTKSYNIECNNKDYSVYDIRRLPELLCKSNCNFMEILFTISKTINPYFYKEIEEIYDMKDEIAKVNLPFLYTSLYNNAITFYNEYSQKGNAKSGSHCLRILRTLQKFARNDFMDFKKALCFDGSPRDLIMYIKSREYDETKYSFSSIKIHKLLSDEFKKAKKYESKYKQYEYVQDTEDKLRKIVKDMVLKYIKDIL